MTDDIIPFREDTRLQGRALRKGLFIGVDKNERYYLGLLPDEVTRRQKRDDPHGKMNINPWLVLCAVTLDDVRNYLDRETGKHRFLSPGEVYGAFLSQALKGARPEMSEINDRKSTIASK